MELQGGQIEGPRAGGLRPDQVEFLSDVCEEYVMRHEESLTGGVEMSFSEAERIVAMELPGFLQTILEDSKHPGKMMYPVTDAMLIIENRRLEVACIFMEACRKAGIRTMRSDTNEQIASEASLN